MHILVTKKFLTFTYETNGSRKDRSECWQLLFLNQNYWNKVKQTLSEKHKWAFPPKSRREEVKIHASSLEWFCVTAWKSLDVTNQMLILYLASGAFLHQTKRALEPESWFLCSAGNIVTTDTKLKSQILELYAHSCQSRFYIHIIDIKWITHTLETPHVKNGLLVLPTVLLQTALWPCVLVYTHWWRLPSNAKLTVLSDVRIIYTRTPPNMHNGSKCYPLSSQYAWSSSGQCLFIVCILTTGFFRIHFHTY